MKKIMIIDGGFSTELDGLGFNVDADPLWGAGALKTDPQAVLQVHHNYVSAGVDVVTSASYQASVDGFVQHLGVTSQQALDLIGDSVRLARQATSHIKRQVLVAGSVGPYGATLHDGSEYNGNYMDQFNREMLREWHRGRVRALVDAGADLLALETQPSLEEALALMDLLREFPNTRAWLSFCCQDPERTGHGEPLLSAVESCLEASASDQLVAVGVNCCPPQMVAPLLDQVRRGAPGTLPLLAYPNSGEKFIPGKGWEWQEGISPLHDYSLDWFRLGASWQGGCCRTGPKDLALVKKALSQDMTD